MRTDSASFISIENDVIGGAELYFIRLAREFFCLGGKGDLVRIRTRRLSINSLWRLADFRGRTVILNNSVLGGLLPEILLLKACGNYVILYPHLMVDHRILGSKFAALRNLLGRLALRLVDKVVAISEGNLASLQRRGLSDKIVKIPNFVECENERPVVVDRTNNIAMIGRIQERHKGQISALRALRDLLIERDIVIHFFGSGPDEGALRSAVAKLGLEKNVVLYGWADVDDIYKADFFAVINNSSWEGLSLALMEAIYHDKAVVACDIEGNRGVVDERFLFQTDAELVERMKALYALEITALGDILTRQKQSLYSTNKCENAIAALQRAIIHHT